MDSTKSFHEISYNMHEKHNAIEGGELSEQQKSWFREDTVDYWRHGRMYAPLTPLLKNQPKSKWITIGDGRFGLDSIKLKKIEPSIEITPTDISTDLLENAKTKGLIERYSTENAEKLSFADNSFDFSFCKESFHHFPRPYIALYEMLRVSKKAVILIEPNDLYTLPGTGKMVSKMKASIKKLLNKKNYHSDHWHFEEIGNYIYSTSKRELEKIALGLNLPAIAVYYFNDHYEQGVELEKADQQSGLFKKIKNEISKRDRLCKMGLSFYSSMVGIIFKETPSKQLTNDLVKYGFEVVDLPENPYAKRQN